MIMSIINSLGAWNWWVLALILLGLEILAPGTFFLWFGISAFVIGTISLAVGEGSTFWVWQTQMIAFVVLSLVAALAGRRFLNQYGQEDIDDPLLNERGRQLVGRTAVLAEPILEGQGRVRLGETMWRVNGPDLPAGTRVRIVDAKSNTLMVEPDAQ
jgi:membrane protein implicated in regulation of membrane protease activity